MSVPIGSGAGQCNRLRALAAVNDSAILRVVAYTDAKLSAQCPAAGAGVVGVPAWTGTDDDGQFRPKCAVLASPGSAVKALCMILTDPEPEEPLPAGTYPPPSHRTSALLDRIEVNRCTSPECAKEPCGSACQSSCTASVTLEDLTLPN